jgi:hypothetical protein
MDEETSESFQKRAPPTGTADSQYGLDLGTNSKWSERLRCQQKVRVTENFDDTAQTGITGVQIITVSQEIHITFHLTNI